MPPKKRIRGPKLPALREEKSTGTDVASDESFNESADFLNNEELNNDQNDAENTVLSEGVSTLRINENMTKEDRACISAALFIK